MSIITLTTDFGVDSPYVAEMKGVVLSINPAVQIVDVTHSVPPQDVRHGAWTMKRLPGAFPPNTIHVGVIDPGVGSNRSILLVRSRRQYYIGPDNGLLSFALREADDVRQLNRAQYWSANISSTFHGRDIMAPVAAHISRGVSAVDLGSQPAAQPVQLSIPIAQKSEHGISGEVVYEDSFGNLVTNIDVGDFTHRNGRPVVVEVAGRTLELVTTYFDAAIGEAIALVGSGGLLEVAVRNGNARQVLEVAIGQTVRVVFAT